MVSNFYTKLLMIKLQERYLASGYLALNIRSLRRQQIFLQMQKAYVWTFMQRMGEKLFIILKCRQQRIEIFPSEQEIDLNILEKGLGDDTTKIILNSKGTMDDVSPEMKKLLDFIDGKEPEDDFTRELDEAVQSVRKNEKWRLDYMTLQMNYQEIYEQGIEQGNKQSALRMIEAGKLSPEEIALYSDLTLEQVLELEKELQPV